MQSQNRGHDRPASTPANHPLSITFCVVLRNAQ
nr:MAG TPA: hypothetical protein [Caudoviricetes sp.]